MTDVRFLSKLVGSIRGTNIARGKIMQPVVVFIASSPPRTLVSHSNSAQQYTKQDQGIFRKDRKPLEGVVTVKRRES